MKFLLTASIVLLSSFFFFGCNTLGVGIQAPGAPTHKAKYNKPGPPPHAPAHGYRHKHRHGHEMKYDSNIGAYVVLNIPQTYFGNNLYIRMSTDGRWIVSATLEGGWRIAAGNEVPPKLKGHKGKKSHPKYNKKSEKHKKNKKYKKHDDDNDYDD